MPALDSLAVFELDGQHFALEVSCIQRVVRAVEITRLPDAPPGILGMINFQGHITPVLDVSVRFGLKRRELRLDDLFVIAITRQRLVAIIVDEAISVIPYDLSKVTSIEKILPEHVPVKGTIRIEDDIMLIHDLELFLTREAHDQLDRLLEA